MPKKPTRKPIETAKPVPLDEAERAISKRLKACADECNRLIEEMRCELRWGGIRVRVVPPRDDWNTWSDEIVLMREIRTGKFPR